MFCKNCGFSVRDGAEFCQSCGADMRASSETPKVELKMPASAPKYEEPASGKKCIKCGMELPADALFCSNCGSTQSDADASAPQSADFSSSPQPTAFSSAPQPGIYDSGRSGGAVPPVPPARPGREIVQPKARAKKKKPAGVIIGAAIVVVALVAVLVTVLLVKNLFGGPFAELLKSTEKMATADSFQTKLSVNADGQKESMTVTYVFDEEAQEAHFMLDAEEVINTNIYALWTENGIFSVSTAKYYSADYESDDGEYYAFGYSDDDGDDLAMLQALRKKDYKQFYKCLEDMLEDADISMSDSSKNGSKLYKAFSKKSVLKDVLGYEKSKSGKTVTYTFNPNVLETMELFLDTVGDDMDEDVVDEIEDYMDDYEDELEDMKMTVEIVVENGYLTSISMVAKADGEKVSMDVTFSKYNEASIRGKSFLKAMEECRDKYE